VTSGSHIEAKIRISTQLLNDKTKKVGENLFSYKIQIEIKKDTRYKTHNELRKESCFYQFPGIHQRNTPK
jgi:hypothetical protein